MDNINRLQPKLQVLYYSLKDKIQGVWDNNLCELWIHDYSYTGDWDELVAFVESMGCVLEESYGDYFNDDEENPTDNIILYCRDE